MRSRSVASDTVGRVLQIFPDKADEVRQYSPLIHSTHVHPIDVGVLTNWNQPDRFHRAKRPASKAMKAPIDKERP